jgi:tetratricopeptide (TPR) repeat protein
MVTRDASPQPDWQRRIASDSPWARALLPAAILAATFLTYVATVDFGFVFDDHFLIVSNGSIRSWHYFPSYFASHIWSFTYPHLLSNFYRPLFLTWLRLNYALFGLRPWGWHLTSLLAHVAVTCLVYCLCLRLTADAWVAGAAGLLFGLHPVHAESVAYITMEPLSTLFVLGAMLTFGRSREPGPRFRWLAASLILTAAALLSKESTLTLPVLISGYAWIYGGAAGREVAPVEGRTHGFARLCSAVGVSIPYWVVILLYVPLRMWALKGFAHVVTPLSLSKEVFTLPSVLLFYLRLLVWPSGLSCYYDTPYISTPSWRDFILPAALLVAVAAALAFWYERTRRSEREEAKAKAIAFGCVWMVLTLLPLFNFRLLPEGEIAHDRYLYLPSVGFALLAAMAMGQARGLAARFFSRPVWALLLAGAIGVMGFATVRQSLYWSDDLTLNYRAHAIAPHNVYATTSLAAAVSQRGMEGAAMALYQQALALQPKFWRANVNLAYLYYAHDNFPEAARFFARACAADPTDGGQFLYLGMSLLRMGQFTEAEKAVRTALLVRPEGKNYHLGLGMVLKGEGRLPEARREIEVELQIDPQNAQARALGEEVTGQIEEQAAESSAAPAPKGRTYDIK